ncbi:hypothetical protein OTERR_22250 [Oryzomicrobium terrae]|uniref:Uncharacterized protein n=1 Tax=Oryzomicrobium terrae TaxID=1735038 RepID=A0A5C1E9P3_9RHOO|nr:hypothetical protein [Oryzomicrobium terrae]QEL65701.1 hypothetical protein OTERR_22250 [Oryzomicrobium terrae]
MSKFRHGTKEPKKQPLLTPKEKKAAKFAKKHPHEEDVVAPVIAAGQHH